MFFTTEVITFSISNTSFVMGSVSWEEEGGEEEEGEGEKDSGELD